MVDRPARVVAKLYGQAGRSTIRLRLSQPEGPGIFPSGQRRSARTYQEVCPSPIASALTKTCSGRMLQS